MNVKVDEEECREVTSRPFGRRDFDSTFGPRPPQPCMVCGALGCSPARHGMPPPSGIRLDGEQDAESDQHEDSDVDAWEEEEEEEEEEDQETDEENELGSPETQRRVSHDEEPIAQIDPEEAALIERELWASRVEHLATAPPSVDAAKPRQETEDQVIVLAFSRFSPELNDLLLQWDLVKSAAERGVDTRPSWAGGATVLVEGLGPEKFEEPLFSSEQLRPWHVVLYKDDEPSLHRALRPVPVRVKKLKPGTSGRIGLPSNGELFAMSDDESAISSDCMESFNTEEASESGVGPSEFRIHYEVKHTFIHFRVDVDSRSVITC